MEQPDATTGPLLERGQEQPETPLSFAYEEGSACTDNKCRFSLLQRILEGVNGIQELRGKCLVPYALSFRPGRRCIVLLSPERVQNPDGTLRSIGSSNARKIRQIDKLGRTILVKAVRKGTGIKPDASIILVGRGLYCVATCRENLSDLRQTLSHLDALVEQAVQNGHKEEASAPESVAVLITRCVTEGVARVLAERSGMTANVTVDVLERDGGTRTIVKIDIAPRGNKAA